MNGYKLGATAMLVAQLLLIVFCATRIVGGHAIILNITLITINALCGGFNIRTICD